MIGQRIVRQRRSPWTIAVLAVLLVAGLLGLFNLALIAIRAADIPPAPLPGELLYLTTFDRFNEQWQQFQGQVRAEIADGQLRIRSDAPREGAFSILDRQFSDFDVRINVSWEKLSETEFRSDTIRLNFRCQDKDNCYEFSIRADGAYRVALSRNRVLETVSEWQISPAVRTEPRAINQLRVVADKFLFTFYINEQLLPLCLKGNDRKSTWNGLTSGECVSNGGRTRNEFVDESFAYGALALGAMSSDLFQTGMVATFDDMLVLGPR